MINSGQIQNLIEGFFSPPLPSIIMKILSWNVRGLNGRTKKRVLHNCIMERNQTYYFFKRQNVQAPQQKRSLQGVGGRAIVYLMTLMVHRWIIHLMEPHYSYFG
jgi:hypothetical protein